MSVFSVNATLLFMIIIFASFVIYTMKYVWPPIMSKLEQRKNIIADGLASSERAKYLIEKATMQSENILLNAKVQAGDIIQEATNTGIKIIETEKQQAYEKAGKMKAEAVAKLATESRFLQKDISSIAPKLSDEIVGKILQFPLKEIKISND